MRRIELSEEVFRLLDWVASCESKGFREAVTQFKERPDITNLRAFIPLLDGLVRLEAFKEGQLSVIRPSNYNHFFWKVKFLRSIIKKRIDTEACLYGQTSYDQTPKASTASFFSIAPSSAPPLETFTVGLADYSTGAIPKKINPEQKIAELLQQQTISHQQHEWDLHGHIESEELVQFLIERGYGKTEGLRAIRLKSYNEAYEDHEFGIDYKGNSYGADIKLFSQNNVAQFSKQFSSEQFEYFSSQLQVQEADSNSTLSLQGFLNQQLKESFFHRKLFNLDCCPKKWDHTLFLVSDSYLEEEQGKAKCKLVLSPNLHSVPPYDQQDTIVWGRTLECKPASQVLQPLLVKGQLDKIWHRPNRHEIFASANVFDIHYVSRPIYEMIKARANQQEDLALLRDNIDHKYFLQLIVKAEPIRMDSPAIICRGPSNIFQSSVLPSDLQSDSLPRSKTFTTARQSHYRQQGNKRELEQVDYKVTSIEVVCLKFILLSHSQCRHFKDFADGKSIIEADVNKEFWNMERDLKNMSALFSVSGYASEVSQRMAR